MPNGVYFFLILFLSLARHSFRFQKNESTQDHESRVYQQVEVLQTLLT
jgi:hypothetical protein